MNDRTKHLLGDVLLLLVAVIWGIGFPAVKLALEGGLPTFTQLSMRFAIASAGLFVWQAMTPAGKINLKKMSTVRHGLILGIFLFLGFAFQTAALVYTTVIKKRISDRCLCRPRSFCQLGVFQKES